MIQGKLGFPLGNLNLINKGIRMHSTESSRTVLLEFKGKADQGSQALNLRNTQGRKMEEMLSKSVWRSDTSQTNSHLLCREA